MGHRPTGDYFPDARRPGRALADLERYVDLPVIIAYRPKSLRVQDAHTTIRGVIRRVKTRPPGVIVEVFSGDRIELHLDRVASVTINHA